MGSASNSRRNDRCGDKVAVGPEELRFNVLVARNGSSEHKRKVVRMNGYRPQNREKGGDDSSRGTFRTTAAGRSRL